MKKLNKERIDAFISSITDAEKEDICKKWIKENSIEEIIAEVSESDKKLSWCMRDPDLGWEMILGILNSAESKRCLSRLGALHLEEWLAMHGELVILRVENEANQNVEFKRLLSCVYQNSMPASVFQKVKDAALYDGYFNDV